MDLERAGAVAAELGLDQRGLKLTRLPGGDIAQSWLLASADARVFLKTLGLAKASVLAAEADGLRALAATGAVRVPRLIGHGQLAETAWLALAFFDLDRRSEACDARLGDALAQLHRHDHDRYGWTRSNYIGLTPQLNPWTDNWSEFFLWQRLGPQLDRLARARPGDGFESLQQPLFEAWQMRFGSHQPAPALIHGDLWQGNAARIAGSDQALLFDPAVHYADRECDLAMTHLFGGFAAEFYQAYEAAWPLPEGHEQRRPFYQLYHLLNHANLFGHAYAERAKGLIARLLASG